MNKRWLQTISSIFFIFLCVGSLQNNLLAQNSEGDEFEVYLDFRHRGVVNSVVISYYKNDEFFLPVSELFSLFNIDHEVNGLVIEGNFGIDQTPYRINFQANRIRFGDKTINITTEDYLLKELDSYLRADIFYEAFELDFSIDFNNLTLNLETDQELPAIEQAIRKQRRQVADRNRLMEDNYELRFDRERPFLDGGFLDYNLSASINSNQNIYNYNTNIGLQVYGGDLQGSLFGSYSENYRTFSTDNLRWRYMYRDQNWLSHLTVGQTTTDGFARNAYTGIRLSNEPIEPRRLFDEFEVQGNTIPQSEVELYLNNALIDFQQADELGNYRFLTPITYGSSQLDLRIYGPTGQILERSSRIQIPFTFQPEGIFNYTVNAGKLDNPMLGSTTRNYTAQGHGAYGITNWLTAEAGVEYYEGVHEGLPTFTSALSSRIMSNYILTAEIASEAYFRGVLNAIYPNSASINIDYTDFTSGLGIYNPSNDDKRLIASVFYPFQFWEVPFNIRASAFSRIRSTTSSTTFRLDGNTRLGKLNLRLGYSDRFTDEIDLFKPTNTAYFEGSATYNISRNRNIPEYLRGIFLRAQMRYQPALNQIESAQALFSRNIFTQGRIQLSVGRNFIGGFNTIRFSLVVDFNKVRTSSTFNNIRGSGNFTQNVRGSIGYDTNYNNFIFTSRDQVGRSAAAIQLFVDNNADGAFNEGDNPISENAVRAKRSGAQTVEKNGILYLTQMNSYYYYNMEMNKSAIKNPMLVPEFEKFGVITDPNRFKKLEIPFYMSGVIEGMVERLHAENRMSGIGGLKLILTGKDNNYSEELRTFSDGGFYSYEVPPGDYVLTVDQGNMDQLNVKSVPRNIEFEVEALPEGDFVEGLSFILIPDEMDREEWERLVAARRQSEQTPATAAEDRTTINTSDDEIKEVIADTTTSEDQQARSDQEVINTEEQGIDADLNVIPPVANPPLVTPLIDASTDTTNAQTPGNDIKGISSVANDSVLADRVIPETKNNKALTDTIGISRIDMPKDTVAEIKEPPSFQDITDVKTSEETQLAEQNEPEETEGNKKETDLKIAVPVVPVPPLAVPVLTTDIEIDSLETQKALADIDSVQRLTQDQAVDSTQTMPSMDEPVTDAISEDTTDIQIAQTEEIEDDNLKDETITTDSTLTEKGLDLDQQQQEDSDQEGKDLDINIIPPVVSAPPVAVPTIDINKDSLAERNTKIDINPDQTLTQDQVVDSTQTMPSLDEPVTDAISEDTTDIQIAQTEEIEDENLKDETITTDSKVSEKELALDQQQQEDTNQEVKDLDIKVAPPVVSIPIVSVPVIPLPEITGQDSTNTHPEDLTDVQESETQNTQTRVPAEPDVETSSFQVDKPAITYYTSSSVNSLTPDQCTYGLQIASYQTEKYARNLSIELSDEFRTYIIYNDPYKLYAVRDKEYRSFGEAANYAEQLNSNIKFDAAVLSQCYDQNQFNLQSDQYFIELKRFATQRNASYYMENINAAHDIGAKFIFEENKPDYIIGTGPYKTKTAAEERIQELESLPEAFTPKIIKKEQPVIDIDAAFEFILLLGQFNTKTEAENRVELITNTFELNSKVLIDEEGVVLVISSKVFTSWSRVMEVRKRITDHPEFQEPTILMVERLNN